VTVISVNPDMLAEFQTFTRTETNPALRKGGQKWRDVWRTTGAAGDPFEFVIVAPIDGLAQYDGEPPIMKALGKEGFAQWEAKSYRFVNRARRYIMRTRPDLSYQGKMAGPPRLAVVTSISVAPGRTREWINYTVNDYMPVMRGAGVTYLVAETVFGGDANEYITLVLRDNFADIEKGPGAEVADRLLKKLPGGVVVHEERSILRYVPDLSIVPEVAGR
jgi:hypothetical protein